MLYSSECSRGKVLLPTIKYLKLFAYKRLLAWYTNKQVTWSTICNHLGHQVWSPPGPASQSGRSASGSSGSCSQCPGWWWLSARQEKAFRAAAQSQTNPEFCLCFKNPEFLSCQHHPLLICHWKCWITALWIKLWSSLSYLKQELILIGFPLA